MMIEVEQHHEGESAGQPLQQIEEAFNNWRGGSIQELGALYSALQEKIECLPVMVRDEATEQLDEKFAKLTVALVGLDKMWQLESIEGWLQKATRDLCVEARERIAAEVTAHYEDAVAAGIGRGLHARMAHVCAMDDLGPPGKAQWKYQFAYLTQYEADALAKGKPILQRPLEKWFNCFSIVILVLVNAAYIFSVGFDSVNVPSICISLLVIYTLLDSQIPPRWLAKRFHRRENLLTLVLVMQCSIALAFMGTVFALAGTSWVSAVALGLTAISLVDDAALYLFYRGRIRRTYSVSA
jgi:hypothetical protein